MMYAMTSMMMNGTDNQSRHVQHPIESSISFSSRILSSVFSSLLREGQMISNGDMTEGV